MVLINQFFLIQKNWLMDNLVPLLNCFAAAQREAKIVIEQAVKINQKQDVKFVIMIICMSLIALLAVIIGLLCKLYTSCSGNTRYQRCPENQTLQPIALSVSNQQPTTPPSPTPPRTHQTRPPIISGVFPCGSYNSSFSNDSQKKTQASK